VRRRTQKSPLLLLGSAVVLFAGVLLSERTFHDAVDWVLVIGTPILLLILLDWPELASAWPDDAGLVWWYRRTLANLIRVLESASADHQCFSFLPAPTPVTMWSRRQASEIAIHRFDAELARGIPSHFEPQFAADMLDELLSGFAPRPRDEDMHVESDRVLHVCAHDVDEHWYLTIDPSGIETSREADDPDLTITGRAADLYLLMWNRTDTSTVTLDGDADLIDVWRESCRVRWSGGV
jgi:uncharacterized protein (TIGR03083 family)